MVSPGNLSHNNLFECFFVDKGTVLPQFTHQKVNSVSILMVAWHKLLKVKGLSEINVNLESEIWFEDTGR